MTFEEYLLAVEYAKITYIRRDIFFVMSGKKKDKKTDLDLAFEHKGIENWVKEQYKKEGMKR